ncbi:hypothetical protein NHX12_014617 [Muraenolepis orangiensis]|uniref:Ig-like domain-containing protein n=1 Tax=Muraenolepis orangiensis TaxID=630683 RepID=A0A9Q0D964_9TELE|nr:hypothetical protein NHX12_014617 [Muraenolepis orangiensis]
MAFPMTFAVLSAVLRIVAAQEEPDYVEVGQRLVLEVTPQDLSAIQKPIEIIRWKFNNDLVVDLLHPNPKKYYGRFKAHTHLDVSSLALAIEPVSSADGGKFHMETWEGTVRTFDVRVIKAPPTPEIILKPLVCDENRCAMQCSVDTQDLGPVTYQWRPDDGVWTDGEELKNMNTSYRSFFCRLRTRLRFSPDSLLVDNPLFKGINHGSTPGAIVGIVIAVILGFIAPVALAFIKFYPEHTVYKRLHCLKNSDLQQPNGPTKEAPAENKTLLDPPPAENARKGQAEHQGDPDGPEPNGPTKEDPAEENKTLLDPPPAEHARKGQAEHQGEPDGPEPNGPTVEAPAEENKTLLDPPPAENARKGQAEHQGDPDGPARKGQAEHQGEPDRPAVVCLHRHLEGTADHLSTIADYQLSPK